MQTSILVEQKMRPIPDNIRVIQDYGNESVTSEDGHVMANGDCMLLEGSKEDLSNWLYPCDCVWVGSGIKGFEAMHIK